MVDQGWPESDIGCGRSKGGETRNRDERDRDDILTRILFLRVPPRYPTQDATHLPLTQGGDTYLRDAIRAAGRREIAYTQAKCFPNPMRRSMTEPQPNGTTKAATSDKSRKGGSVEGGQASAPVFRETVESFAVALILAFLFRAFVAEAFVIPTGSMAPTLMGAHKDVTCPECGFGYQSGASSEFDQDRNGAYSESVVVGTACPLCRYQLPLDLKGNANHATFSGDRILVSKFAYLAREPKRWEVIVFKYPLGARQNYIKRLTGRPNEMLRVHHGDIHVQPLDRSKPFEIARKPANVVGAVLQPVHDSKHLPKSLVKAGLPSYFQPFPNRAEGSPWKVDQTANAWKAQCSGGDGKEVAWLRYFHRVVDPRVWDQVMETGSFPVSPDPYAVRLITDFTHYNASRMVAATSVYSHEETTSRLPSGATVKRWVRVNKFAPTYRSGKEMPEATLRGYNNIYENDGLHWVGDLACEFELDIESKSGIVLVDLVEFGIHHQCQIDLATGKATLRLLKNGEAMEAVEDGKGGFVGEMTTDTPIRGGGKYRVRMANFDDQIYLWVGGRLREMSPTNRFQSERMVKGTERVPHWSPEDPMDGAPVGLGVLGAKVQVTRARVWRDIYYVATQGSGQYCDYEKVGDQFGQSVSESMRQRYAETVDPKRKVEPFREDQVSKIASLRDTLYSSPNLWGNALPFTNRRQVEFTLDEDQYFPMGDNSPESFDARGWRTHFVPERLMIGRAVLVFWPHYWNRPIPFTPNIQRMGLIR